MKISKLLHLGSESLKKNKIDTHQLDSELILSSILKKQRENLLINLNKKVTKKVVSNFNDHLKRRITKEPIAYILEKKEFWSKNFFVNKNTLIPRPETELLSENIIKMFKNKKIFLLDVGTGTGCIILSVLSELQKSTGIGIDISKKAIEVAKINLDRTNLAARVKFYTKSFEQVNGYKFDLIISNPPYIKKSDLKNLTEDVRKFEPKIALDGGNDGLDVIRKVIYKSRTILKKLGTLALEVGFGQHLKVSHILKKQGFRETALIKDYQQNVRCIFARLKN